MWCVKYCNTEGKTKVKIVIMSMYLTFGIVPSYTVFIFNIISLFEAKYIPIFVYKICRTHLLSKYFHFLLNNFIDHCPIFHIHLLYPNT
jgi:hypothetical protein